MKENAINQILTKDAVTRLSNIKMVKPERAEMLEIKLIQLAKSGHITNKIDEAQLIGMLEQFSDVKAAPKITIHRRKDSDDFNEDDYK